TYQPIHCRSQLINDDSSNTNKDDQNKSSIEERLPNNNKNNSFIKNYQNLNSTDNLNPKYENNFTEKRSVTPDINEYLPKDSPFFEDPYLRSLIMEPKQIECNGCWIKYEAELRSTFVDDDRIHKIRSELVNLKHKEGMSIEYYISKFLTLTNHLSSLSEEEKIFYFKEGLKDDTKRELICRG
ncbi:unnamed protein product, partial [Brachionus calyciflorus]